MRIFSICFFLALSHLVGAQHLDFDIRAAGKQIGNFYIERLIAGDSIFYQSESKASVNLIISDYTIQYISSAFYLKDTLSRCKVTVIVNGKFKKSTETHRTEKGYLVKYTDDEQKVSLKKFDHAGYLMSSSTLFYNVPQKGDTSYAELFGNGGVIQYRSPTEFEVVNLDGYNPTNYFLKNGVVHQRIVENMVTNFVMTKLGEKENIGDPRKAQNSSQKSSGF